MTTWKRVVYALVVALLLCSVAAPARADRDDDHWHHGRGRGHWRHDRWRERTYYAPERTYYYSEPDVYYAPPPVYVAPPPPPGGLSFIFPFHIH